MSRSPCTTIIAPGTTGTGTRTTRGVRESWVIRDGNNVIYVTDTVSFIGRSRPLVYQSIRVCRN